VPEPEHLEILVESDLLLPSAETPRRVLEAMRRHLRQHAAGTVSGPGASESPLTLIQTREGQHHLPQGLLPALTEACRRQGVTYTVVDRRAMVACPALRSRRRLGEAESEAVRRLLLRDGGVLVGASAEQRRAIAVELLARRQQRTLIAAAGPGEAERWLGELEETLGLEAPLVSPLRRATAETRIAVGHYPTALQLRPDELRHGFGMVILDGLETVDALTSMKLLRSVGAHYLLGLARAETRADGLQGTLYLALGGIAHTLPEPASAPPRLGCRLRATELDFAYDGRSQYQALMAALARDRARAELVAADVIAEARAGQACLVLSERRDHLEQLAELLPPELPLEVLTSMVRPADRSDTLRRFQEGEVKVLLATGQIASEAISVPRATRLFITFPFAYLRKLEVPIRWLLQPQPGKTEVLVFDYDDHRVVPLHRAFEKRRAFLERMCREAEAEALQRAQMPLPL
jgi:superfamily II DNA or RNA helicase